MVEYTYDFNNIWIRKIVGNSKTIFIPENYQTVAQIDDAPLSHIYLWTPNAQDKLLADVTPTATLWSLTDHLGTIRDVLGATTTHLTYDAFGNLTSSTANPLLFGYTGKPFDASTQLQNNINRWYDPTVGRWLSVDPIGFTGNDANLYRYCHNNTIINVDKNGLRVKMWWEFLPKGRRSVRDCGIILYLGHGTTSGGHDTYGNVKVPHDMKQFYEDLEHIKLLKSPNIFFAFLGC